MLVTGRNTIIITIRDRVFNIDKARGDKWLVDSTSIPERVVFDTLPLAFDFCVRHAASIVTSKADRLLAESNEEQLFAEALLSSLA